MARGWVGKKFFQVIGLCLFIMQLL